MRSQHLPQFLFIPLSIFLDSLYGVGIEMAKLALPGYCHFNFAISNNK